MEKRFELTEKELEDIIKSCWCYKSEDWKERYSIEAGVPSFR